MFFEHGYRQPYEFLWFLIISGRAGFHPPPVCLYVLCILIYLYTFFMYKCIYIYMYNIFVYIYIFNCLLIFINVYIFLCVFYISICAFLSLSLVLGRRPMYRARRKQNNGGNHSRHGDQQAVNTRSMRPTFESFGNNRSRNPISSDLTLVRSSR